MTETHAHMHDFEHHKNLYIKIFAALMGLTVLTVGAKYLNIPIVSVTIFIAVLIAAIKASLVALFFMHLSAERKIIYVMLILMVLCVIGLFLLPTAMQHGPITGTTASPLSVAGSRANGAGHGRGGEEAPLAAGTTPADSAAEAGAHQLESGAADTGAAAAAASTTETPSKENH
ncbi:MAG: cytochrome C oxidase subunit IV family protein [Candidatus Hydrogenedentota bacterium]